MERVRVGISIEGHLNMPSLKALIVGLLVTLSVAAKPNPEYARVPIAATEHSKKLEAKLEPIKKPVAPCTEELNQPCQVNADCKCSKFCSFEAGDGITDGCCVAYTRAEHN